MRKISFLILCALGLNQIQADQEPPFTYHVGAHFGQNFADSSSKMRDNALYGIRGTVMLTPFYGLNFGIDRLDSIDIKESASTIDVTRFYGQIEIDGEEQYHVVPYITMGAGYEMLSSDVVVDGHKYDVSQAYLSAGLGFRYNFIPELSFYVEGNGLWKTDTTDVDTNFLAGFVYHVNATTCDDTYVTERLQEKPEERTKLHVGKVNALSGWRKTVGVETKVHKKPFSATAKTNIDVSKQKPVMHKRPVKVAPVVMKSTKTKSVQKTKIVKKSKRVHTPVNGAYYVLLGAYKTDKGLKEMLQKLDKRGVSYILRDNHSKKLTYVMAGAYPTLQKAKSALRKLKRIQPDAYIRRMR